MISRFALTPGTLAEARCSSTAALELCVGCLNDLCRGEGVFVDMRNGNWSRAVDSVGPLAKRFLTFARKNRRLISTPPQLPSEPDTDEEWLWEAQRFHQTHPCRAILTHRELAEIYNEPPVACIEGVNQTSWWEARSPSKTVNRSTRSYLQALELILRHANSLMFIDPFVDPRADNYREFPQLLVPSGTNGRHPVIEIHRASWRRIDGRNQVQPLARWMADFEPWSARLTHASLKATVFLWEEMHDRYLISDLIGINAPYGFDISEDANETTKWFRLGPSERDQQQREFDPACGIHGFVGSFEIGQE